MKTKKVIWKFPLDVIDMQDVVIPQGSEILSVQTQNERPCMWVMVDMGTVGKKNETIRLKTASTGDPFDFHTHRFLGTYQIGYAFVGHVFQVYVPKV